ncbi:MULTISPECIES: hypothetical protein [Chryseobacterium]|uniref:hypothetical protein n=1 Tax=Chryseobacterium TaxID=59732 RepID=UPI001E2E7126|nr:MULTISPECIES: hypothetical protein [Chryseobacterium]MCE3074480.1 hypothetical protein [Chryseobacterium gwangjuense]MDR6462268.1 hypothetical protein [Chryseobacterium sediminis]
MKDYYRLTNVQKVNISQNLIDILEKEICPSPETITFICNWILTDRSEKFKAYYDVWEIVLKNFYPKARPILIRSISRKSKHEYIASFTNSAYSAERFGEGKGYWIICDTKDSLISDIPMNKKGSYRNTFYPLSDVLKKAKEKDGWGFTQSFLSKYSGEDEYIMKINFSHMQLLKYINIED